MCQAVGFIATAVIANLEAGLRQDSRGQITSLTDLAIHDDRFVSWQLIQTCSQLIDRDVDRFGQMTARELVGSADVDQRRCVRTIRLAITLLPIDLWMVTAQQTAATKPSMLIGSLAEPN